MLSVDYVSKLTKASGCMCTRKLHDQSQHGLESELENNATCEKYFTLIPEFAI